MNNQIVTVRHQICATQWIIVFNLLTCCLFLLTRWKRNDINVTSYWNPNIKDGLDFYSKKTLNYLWLHFEGLSIYQRLKHEHHTNTGLYNTSKKTSSHKRNLTPLRLIEDKYLKLWWASHTTTLVYLSLHFDYGPFLWKYVLFIMRNLKCVIGQGVVRANVAE